MTVALKNEIIKDKLNYIDADISFIQIAKANKIPLFSNDNSGYFSGIDKNFDLAYGEAIVVTTGNNSNGQYFSNEFIPKVLKSFIFKPVNIEHMQGFIIGVMYDSAVFYQSKTKDKANGKIVKDLASITRDDELEIKVRFALFQLIFPSTIGDIINGSAAIGQKPSIIKISMELFSDEYGFILDLDESTFKAKDKQNAFLDNYVGMQYRGVYISKMYTKGTFVGMAIVEYPADKKAQVLEFSSSGALTKKGIRESFVLDKTKFKKNILVQQGSIEMISEEFTNYATIQQNTEEKTFKMDQELKKLFQNLSSELASGLESKINSLMVKDENLKVNEARQKILVDEIENQSIQIQKLNKTIEENKSTTDASELAQEEMKDKFATESAKVSEFEKDKTSSDEKIADLKTELAEFKSSEIGEVRMKELSSLGLTYPKDKQEEKTDHYGKMDNAVYSKFLESMEGMNFNKTDNANNQEATANAASIINKIDTASTGTQIANFDEEGVRDVMKTITSRKNRGNR